MITADAIKDMLNELVDGVDARSLGWSVRFELDVKLSVVHGLAERFFDGSGQPELDGLRAAMTRAEKVWETLDV